VNQELTMPDPTTPTRRPGRGIGQPVRLDPGIVRQARLVAAHDQLELGVYLATLLRPHVARDYGRVAAELAAGDGI
jgi:hypothetical protein